MSWFETSNEDNKKKNPFEKKPPEKRRPAKAPCPRCGSWETTVENGIFHCENCNYEGG